MSFITPTDPDARGSIYAVVACTFATILGAVTAWTLSGFALATSVILAASASAAICFAVGAWCLRHPSVKYDPISSFSTHLFCVFSSLWSIHFFFARPEIGPFAQAPWTVCDGLGNVVFGFALSLLVGATLGFTYAAARPSGGTGRWHRPLFSIACLLIFAYVLFRVS